MWRVFVVYCCCLLIKGSSCVFILPIDLIWWWKEGNISVCLGWSFLGEWPRRGTILIKWYLSQGLAVGCRGSSGSWHVLMRRRGSHLQPTCFAGSAVWKQIPQISLCSWDHGNVLVLKEMPEISLPQRSLRGAPTECLVFSFRKALLPLFLVWYKVWKLPPGKPSLVMSIWWPTATVSGWSRNLCSCLRCERDSTGNSCRSQITNYHMCKIWPFVSSLTCG